MTDTDTRNRLGRILYAAGSVWIALYFVARFVDFGGTPFGDIMVFFRSSFLIPLILLFVGRSMQKRSRRTSVEETMGQMPEPSEHQNQPMPPPAPRPEPRRPAPAPPVIEPEPVDMDELAKAIGFETSEETPGLADSEVEGVGPKTSAEMIEDAHRQYKDDG
ncbi:MAG: hypothetical protein ACC658_13735 [Acidimicrobiia bacterium]